MKWAYAVTTIPKRFNDTLPRTLQSLFAAGFDAPWIFIDAVEQEVPPYLKEYQLVWRHSNIKTVGHWLLTAYEQFIREPEADRYAIFQDDFVTCRNLRAYLDKLHLGPKDYWNLYTFPENVRDRKGFYPSNQLGKGAVALVFSNGSMRNVLSSTHMVDKLMGERRSRAVDGGIVCSIQKAGGKELVHNPSLVQHIGNTSSMGNREQPLAPNFIGEDYDASTLEPQDHDLSVRDKIKKQKEVGSKSLPHTRPPARKRIGLVGYCTPTGLGQLNKQLAKHIEIDHWLIYPHRRYGVVDAPNEYLDITVCDTGAKVCEFLHKVDVVVFAEVPIYKNLIPLCKELQKRTVCIPMHEWMPSNLDIWPKSVDLFMCPNRYSYDLFKKDLPCTFYNWPFDVNAFEFVRRDKVESFLFINGNGGYKNRKGSDVIDAALQIDPTLPIYAISQREWRNPSARMLEPPQHNRDLYNQGDVLLCPHKVDGLGLEPMEAMICGMPTIATYGKPWDELPLLGTIESRQLRQHFARDIDWYEPSAKSLVEVCRNALGKSLSDISFNINALARARSWESQKAEYTACIRYGVPDDSL